MIKKLYKNTFLINGPQIYFFSSCISDLDAVKKKNNPDVTERDIEDHIKVWLKHSPQRHKIEIAKLQNQ